MEGVQFKWKGKSFTLLPGEKFLVEPSTMKLSQDILRVITPKGSERRREAVEITPSQCHATFRIGTLDSALAKLASKYKAASAGVSIASAFPIIQTAPAPNARCFTASMGRALKADDAYTFPIAKADPYSYQGLAS